MKKKSTAVIAISELEELIKGYVRTKFKGEMTKVNYNSFSHDGTVRVYFDVEFDDDTDKALEEMKELEVKTEKTELSKTKVKEPACTVDDTIIIFGITEEGKEIIERFGHVWRITNGKKDAWLISPRPNIAGKYFRGREVRPKIYLNCVDTLEKDKESIKRRFRIIAVCKFPKVFSPKVYKEKLEGKGIDIKEL